MPWIAAPAILLADEGDGHDRKEVSMYHYNDFEAWREHRNVLLQEAEDRRLARQVRAARSSEESNAIRHALLGFVAGLLPQSRKVADC